MAIAPDLQKLWDKGYNEGFQRAAFDAGKKAAEGTAINRTPQNKSGLDKFLGAFGTSTSRMLAVGSLVCGGMALSKAVKEVRDDTRRKQIIESLHATDPVLSQLSPEQIMEWYAAIYHFAPKFSLDKSAVREVLQNFARFGRVDVNTLKMLADTEKSTQQAEAAGKSWGDVFGGLAKSLTLGG